MQQIRAYKDGSKRWVIVIEDSDAGLDRFVSDLIRNLSNASAKPVRHLEEPEEMAVPQIDCDVLDEIKTDIPKPPVFVSRIKSEEKDEEDTDSDATEEAPETDTDDAALTQEKSAAEHSSAPDAPNPLDEDIRDFLRLHRDDKRLKDIIMRRYHTSDIDQVISQRPQKELILLKKQIG